MKSLASIIFLFSMLSGCILIPHSYGKSIAPRAEFLETRLRHGMTYDEVLELVQTADLPKPIRIGLPKESLDELCREPGICVPEDLPHVVKYEPNKNNTVMVANETHSIILLTIGRLLYRIDFFFSPKTRKLIGWASDGVWAPEGQ